MSNWNFQKKILAELSRRSIPLRSGKEVHIQVLHDEWCDRYRGLGPCNCDPKIGEIGPNPPDLDRD